MGQLVQYFLMTMGVLFLFVLAAIWYIWSANLWNVQALRTVWQLDSEVFLSSTSTDATTVPTINWSALDDETRACLVALFGEERLAVVEEGAQPTTLEITQGLVCWQ